MLTKIVVESENAFDVPILGVTPKDSLLIKQVTGLNPPDVTLFIGDYARDGGNYQGRRVGNRNVVFLMELNPNPADSVVQKRTVSGLREMIYKAFVDPQVDGDWIKINLHDDEGRVRYVLGYTEKFETEIFSIDTLCQVSIICPDPYIRDDFITIKTPPPPVSPTAGWTTVPFTYGGTAETGFEVEIYLSATTTNLTLDNNGKKMVLGPTLSVPQFSAGDVVYINTNRGSRDLRKTSLANMPAAWSSSTTYVVGDVVAYNNTYWTALVGNSNVAPADGTTWQQQPASVRWAKLLAAGSTTSLIANLSPSSPWLELHSQDNKLKIYGAAEINLPAVIKSLTYTTAYWGI